MVRVIDFLSIVPTSTQVRFFDLSSGFASNYKDIKNCNLDPYIDRNIKYVFFGGCSRIDSEMCVFIILCLE